MSTFRNRIHTNQSEEGPAPSRSRGAHQSKKISSSTSPDRASRAKNSDVEDPDKEECEQLLEPEYSEKKEGENMLPKSDQEKSHHGHNHGAHEEKSLRSWRALSLACSIFFCLLIYGYVQVRDQSSSHTTRLFLWVVHATSRQA